MSKGPTALNSGLYAKEYNEVKALGGRRERAHARAAHAVRLLPGEPGRDVQPVLPDTRARRGSRVARAGTSLRDVWRSRAGTRTSPAGRQGALELLASADGHPARRRRTATRRRKRLGLDISGRNSAVSRPSSGYNCNTGIYMKVAELYFGQGRTTSSSPPERNDAGVRPLPRRLEGHDRRPRLSRHPLPLRQTKRACESGRDVARWVEKHALQAVK